MSITIFCSPLNGLTLFIGRVFINNFIATEAVYFFKKEATQHEDIRNEKIQYVQSGVGVLVLIGLMKALPSVNKNRFLISVDFVAIKN